MSDWDALFGPNAGYAIELYEQFQRDPASVDAATRAFFENHPPARAEVAAAVPPAAFDGARRPTGGDSAPVTGDAALRIVLAARLARSIREYGHLAARLDPLGTPPPGDPMLDQATHGLTDADLAALPATIVWPDADANVRTCLDAINQLRAIYCGSLGYDIDHVEQYEERAWLVDAIESGAYAAPLSRERQLALLERLSEVESFERFLHTTFQGQKRFSIEGTDMLVPMLDELIPLAAEAGTREVVIGMAHRGRLNVLAHVLGKPYATIFSEFHTSPNKELVPSEGSMGINFGWTGDVKYHLGAETTVREEDNGDDVLVKLTMAHNPSHLEFVNPAIEGITRAAQDRRDHRGAPEQRTHVALAVAIHGDAAFPGEGVVAETLNLSHLAGYQTGGTVHIIVNNQIGFTTVARDGRSTLYAGDLAKGFEIPIIHVNGDDPEACLTAIRLAHAYRVRFRKDALVDLIGYRRWGHNEGDEPSFTQPKMYAEIGHHPTVRAIFAERMEREQSVSREDASAMLGRAQERLRAAHESLLAGNTPDEPTAEEVAPSTSTPTAVPTQALLDMNSALLAWPEGFTPVSRLARLLARRKEAIEKDGGIDWAHAEALAFASILADGTPIRMSGQDAERGTFSQRHLVLHDANTNARYVPLQALPQARASFAVYNSPLSEAAVMGFEYGYSVHAPDALVLWEAQFGDFANAGQVIIDQFIAAARAKWREYPSLVLLLPHGSEGQGPEHSSARLERFLQLAAEDNLRIANCTTAAQYFHALRLHAAHMRSAPRPFVVMTPKSLLRHPRAASSLRDLAEGSFQPVLDDPQAADRRDRVERLILCSGKIAVDLTAPAESRREPPPWIAVARLELLYPFPETDVAKIVAEYPNLREIVWLQEEPRNMGAWSFVAPRLRKLLPQGVKMRYVGRPERASPAEGLPDMYAAEQAYIIEAAYAGERQASAEARGGQYVG